MLLGAVSLQLTMTRHEQKASDELQENIVRLSDELSADSILQSRPEEPWRQFSLLIQKKIGNTLENKGYTVAITIAGRPVAIGPFAGRNRGIAELLAQRYYLSSVWSMFLGSMARSWIFVRIARFMIAL